MNTLTKTTIQSFNNCERITTSFYEEVDGIEQLLRQTIITNYFTNNYSQTIIKDKWGYTTMWYDNRGRFQEIGHDIILEGKDKGKLHGPSWFISDSEKFIFNNITYPEHQFKQMRLNYLR